MSRFYNGLYLILCLNSYLGLGLYAEECCTSRCQTCLGITESIELKAGYLFFTNSSLKNVYKDGGFDIRVVGSFPLWKCNQNLSLELYAATEYFRCSGKSTFGEDTTIWGIPLSLGLKPVFFVNPNLKYYCAFGPRYLYIQQHNDSVFVPKEIDSHCGGFFLNMGFDFTFWDCLFVNLFGEYSYTRGHFHISSPNVFRGTSNISCLIFGAGFGYKF